jgi:peptide-methionine (S)-S-oxide reductase
MTLRIFVQMDSMIKEATFGAGCFWCVEACFGKLKGVKEVYPGYCGGETINPTYDDVCRGDTGHAEVVRVLYDETVVSYDALLEVFWFVHDPTQLNRQGNDIGTQYRSVIFFHDEEQRLHAVNSKQKMERDHVFLNPIVTEIVPVQRFYKAETYHQDYFKMNPMNAYCQAVIRPKYQKFEVVFRKELKQ